jgi:hypothetical protein
MKPSVGFPINSEPPNTAYTPTRQSLSLCGDSVSLVVSYEARTHHKRTGLTTQRHFALPAKVSVSRSANGRYVCGSASSAAC